jgi:hypothetical protein
MDEKKYYEPGKIGETTWDTSIKKTIGWQPSKIRIIEDPEPFNIHWIKIGNSFKMKK